MRKTCYFYFPFTVNTVVSVILALCVSVFISTHRRIRECEYLSFYCYWKSRGKQPSAASKQGGQNHGPSSSQTGEVGRTNQWLSPSKRGGGGQTSDYPPHKENNSDTTSSGLINSIEQTTITQEIDSFVLSRVLVHRHMSMKMYDCSG